MKTPVGQTPAFETKWQALMRQLAHVRSIAHRREPNETETAEAVSIAQYHLARIGEELGIPRAVTLPQGRIDNIRRAAARCGDPIQGFVAEWLGDIGV